MVGVHTYLLPLCLSAFRAATKFLHVILSLASCWVVHQLWPGSLSSTSAVPYPVVLGHILLPFPSGVQWNACGKRALIKFHELFWLNLVSLCVFSILRSYRKYYIEASGYQSMHIVFKVLGGWDFGLTSLEAVTLKHKSTYNEFKVRQLWLQCL